MGNSYANRFSFVISNSEVYVQFYTAIPILGDDGNVLGEEKINNVGLTMSSQTAIDLATKILGAFKGMGYDFGDAPEVKIVHVTGEDEVDDVVEDEQK